MTTAAKQAAEALEAKTQLVEQNKGRVFLYDDQKFSKGKLLVDWPGVCTKYGWDGKELCGPFVMSFKGKRDEDCPDITHGYAPARYGPHIA